MKIGIYGSGGGIIDEEVKRKARLIGRLIAEKGHAIVTGGCNGIPHEAALGAAEAGGKCIGYSPATSLKEHKKQGLTDKGFSEIIFIPSGFEHSGDIRICMKYRNVMSVAACDACIIIGGRLGTLNEFTIAADSNKVVGILEGTGGVSDGLLQKAVEVCHEKIKSPVIFEKDPEALVEKVVKAAKLKQVL